jgi:hypothetical protein
MDMIGHQHVCIKYKFEFILISFNSLEILLPVLTIEKDILALIATDYDMIKSTGKFYSEGPCHGGTIL